MKTPPEKMTRRKDPPSQSQLASDTLRQREHDRDALFRKYVAMAAEELARVMAPPASGVPLPPAPPPPPPRPRLQINSKTGALEVPCTLTKAQFGSGPSDFLLRQARAMRERCEAEAAKQAEHDRLRHYLR
jgi:hypothetical protein